MLTESERNTMMLNALEDIEEVMKNLNVCPVSTHDNVQNLNIGLRVSAIASTTLKNLERGILPLPNPAMTGTSVASLMRLHERQL